MVIAPVRLPLTIAQNTATFCGLRVVLLGALLEVGPELELLAAGPALLAAAVAG